MDVRSHRRRALWHPALASFPGYIDRINKDPDVRLVDHLGDIKNGSSDCTDEYFATIRADFDRFADPLVYTPGDNEWTDCHRVNARNPLERLAKVRRTFFTHPHHSLGRAVRLHTQTHLGVPENVRYARAGVGFATLHVVGSNNDLMPWTGLGNTAPTRAQIREERSRMAATLLNMHRAFRAAKTHHRRAVVLMQQADMFDPTVVDPRPSDYSAFRPLVRALIREANAYDGPVYLFNGDSHRFNQDRPVAAGSPWLSFYGLRRSADTVQRTTVDGSDLGESDYLKVTVHRRGPEVLTFSKVPTP